jgi:branched-chain amino acid aminotransferase
LATRAYSGNSGAVKLYASCFDSSASVPIHDSLQLSRPQRKDIGAMPTPTIWMNGHMTPAADAQVSIFDHGLLYGDGVFEGIRFYDRRPFRLAQHIARLERSARGIDLVIPYCAGALTEATEAVVAASNTADGYIRMVVTRGVGDLGLDPRSCPWPNVFLVAAPLRLFDGAREQGVDVVLASTRQTSPDTLDPRIKGLNYLNRLLARIEAVHANAAEAIMLNARGTVAEGTTDNVFIVRGGTLRTPPASDGALEGITRDVVMQLASTCDVRVREESLAPFDMFTAEEIFLSGTAAGLVPVRTVSGRPVLRCPGPVFRRLESALDALVRSEVPTRVSTKCDAEPRPETPDAARRDSSRGSDMERPPSA